MSTGKESLKQHSCLAPFSFSKEKGKQPEKTPVKSRNKSEKPKRGSKNDSRKSITFTAGKIKSRSCKIHENKLLENQKSRDSIKDVFFTLKDEICEIDRKIEEKISKRMVTFISNGKGMVWFSPLVTKIKIHLRKGEYTDKYNKIKKGWGGYPLLSVSSDDMDIDYLKDLFFQAYNM